MIGIEGKEGEVLFLPIERTNKYESYDGTFLFRKYLYIYRSFDSVERGAYSLSFLSKKDRDYVLYEYGGITTFLEDEFTLRRMKW